MNIHKVGISFLKDSVNARKKDTEEEDQANKDTYSNESLHLPGKTHTLGDRDRVLNSA